LGRTRVTVAHGKDGSDELSIAGKTHLWELDNGQTRHHMIDPSAAGLEAHSKRGLRGSDAATNAQALRDILDGETNAYADAVLLNAAAMLEIAGRAADLKQGVILAREAIHSGAAHAKLGALVEATHG